MSSGWLGILPLRNLPGYLCWMERDRIRLLLSRSKILGCALERGLKRLKGIPQVGRLLVQRTGAIFLLGDSDFVGREARLKV